MTRHQNTLHKPKLKPTMDFFAYFEMPSETSFTHSLGSMEVTSPKPTPSEAVYTYPKKTVLLKYKTQTPDQFPFDAYTVYKTRLLSLFNGIIYALNQEKIMLINSKRLNPALDHELHYKFNALTKLKKQKIAQLDLFKNATLGSPVSFNTELYQFFQHELPFASGLKPKQILLAEAFYVWQKVTRPKRQTLHYRSLGEQGFLRIEQRETPRHAELTLDQKNHLLQVHLDYAQQPNWFKALDLWAQSALCHIIPITLEGNWTDYQRCHPTVLRHIPGEANASLHEFIITHINKNNIETTVHHSSSLRQGAPSCFGMKNSVERAQSAADNLEQMLNQTIKQAQISFEHTWGIKAHKDFPLPILLCGLVTPYEQAQVASKILDVTNLSGEDNNTRLSREKSLAHKKYCGKNKNNDIRIFNLDVAINKQRKKDILPDINFIQFARKFYAFLNKQTELQATHRKRLALLDCSIKALARLLNTKSNPYRRNQNLYIAALYDVITRLMQGLSTGNCKSSKDRKGVALIVADAILNYLQEKQIRQEPLRLPALDDIGTERSHFLELFSELYATGHQLLVAHDNSPGSPGIKDEGILDKDMIASLQNKQGLYKKSKEIADFNKPGTFWKKHEKTIKRSALTFGLITFNLICISLLVSGVLSPIGLIGGAAALKLGSAASVIGGLSELLLGNVVIYTGIELTCSIKNSKESKHERQTTFAAQAKAIAAKNTTQEDTPESHKGSTYSIHTDLDIKEQTKTHSDNSDTASSSSTTDLESQSSSSLSANEQKQLLNTWTQKKGP